MVMVPPFCGGLDPSKAPITKDDTGLPVVVLPMEDGVLFPKGSPVVEPVDEGVAPADEGVVAPPGVLGGGGGTVSVILFFCLLSGD